MQWATSLSKAPETSRACAEALAGLSGVAGARVDLLLVFATAHHAAGWPGLVEALRAAHPAAVLLGCSAGGVIGGGHEVEDAPGLSLCAAHLPDVDVVPFTLGEALVGRDRGLTADALAAALAVDPDARPTFLVLTDPFTCDAEALLSALDARYPTLVKIGGLASGARGPGEHTLVAGHEVVRGGAVGVALVGDLTVDPVVAQGCRPVSGPLRVTAADGHVVHTLDGEPAARVLERALDAMEPQARLGFERSPMVGVAMRRGGAVRAGDFLLRHLLGVDPRRGAIAVAHKVEVGDVLCLHVRDPRASAEDLAELVGRWAREHEARPPAAALLFSCLGRGARFYGTPDHDSDVLRDALGDEVVIAGFFGNGELGPVHGRAFLHGYTSAVALVRQRDWN